jgi:hypothetical protein
MQRLALLSVEHVTRFRSRCVRRAAAGLLPHALSSRKSVEPNTESHFCVFARTPSSARTTSAFPHGAVEAAGDIEALIISDQRTSKRFAHAPAKRTAQSPSTCTPRAKRFAIKRALPEQEGQARDPTVQRWSSRRTSMRSAFKGHSTSRNLILLAQRNWNVRVRLGLRSLASYGRNMV